MSSMLVVGSFQALEIGGLIALVAIGVLLWGDSLSDMREVAPLAFRLSVAVGIGLVAGLIAVILQEDVVPDWIEAAGRPVLFGALAIGLILAARRLRS